MSTKHLSIFFGLALVGCASTQPGKPGDGSGDGGGGGGEGSGSGSNVPLDASGKYAMQSTYDIAQNMPGTVGVVLNDFIAASNDPGKFVIDQILAQMPSGTFKSILQGAEPFVTGYIDQRLQQIAPDFVLTIQQVGQDFGDMAKHFGLNETLDVAKAGAGYSSTHTVLGAHFVIGGVASDYNFADYQVANVVANNVAFSMDNTGKLALGEHKLPLAYGKILRIGLDAAIIPAIDANATDLQTLLADKIDCAAVGQAISDAVGIGGASAWASACSGGLVFGANAVYQKLDAIDRTALEFDVTGSAKAVAHSGRIDTLQTGKWQGTLSYSGTPAPLSTATFTGTRM